MEGENGTTMNEASNSATENTGVSGASGSSSHINIAPAPHVEIKLFIGRVPPNMDEALVKPVFEQYGEVKEVVVIRDKASGKHKHSAFVKMGSITAADAAIRGLNNIRVLDPTMGAMTVKYATGEPERVGIASTSCEPGVDQVKLFVGSIPKTLTDEELREFFSQYGGVEETFIMKDNASNTGRGCAFVKMSLKEQALHSINVLNGKHVYEGCSRPMEVRFAETKQQRQQQQMMNVAPRGMAMGRGMGMGGGMNMGGMGGPAMGGNMNGNGPVGSNSNPRCFGQWKEYFTQEGRPYYHNEYTGVTQWDKPAEFTPLPPNPSFGGGSNNPMPGDDGKEQNGPPGANIFVFHVPNDWTQYDLINAFSQFGAIISARVATDRTTGRNKGFAFVSYETPDAAGHAVASMNGFMAAGKRLKVTIKKGEEQHAARVSPMPFQQQMGGGAGGRDNQWGNSGGNNSGGYGGYSQHAPGGYGQPNASGYGQGGVPQQQRYAPY